MTQYHDSLWGGAHLGEDKTVKAWIHTCPACQINKKPTSVQKSTAPMGVIEVGRVWDLVSIDLWGPVTTSRSGNCYILTVVDGLSKFAWALPIPNKEMETVASTLWNSDQGREFVNQVIKGMCQLLGPSKTQTSAYSPQGNAYAERIHRFFRNAISSFVRDDPRIWDEVATGMMLAYNDAYHSALKTSPGKAFLGRNLNALYSVGKRN